RRVLAAIEHREFISKMAALLLGLSDDMGDRADTSGIRVTKLERVTEGGHPLVRVLLEDRTPGQWVPWRSFSAVLSVEDQFATRSDGIETGQGATLSGEFAYERHDGLPVLRSYL